MVLDKYIYQTHLFAKPPAQVFEGVFDPKSVRDQWGRVAVDESV